MATEYVGHLREFDPANSEWSIFKKRLESYFVANKIEDEKRKSAILLNILSENAYRLLYNLCIPEEPEQKTYKDLAERLTEYFKPSESVFGARFKFYNAKKSQNESPREWAARLKSLIAPCQFETNEIKILLRDFFVVGYNKGPVQDRLMEEKKSLTFEEAVEVASIKSVVQPTTSGCSLENFMKKETELHYSFSNQRKNPFSKGSTRSIGDVAGTRASSSQHARTAPASQQPSHSDKFPKCTVCGRRNHTSVKCSFKNCICHICNKKGHLAPMCYQKKNSHRLSQNYLESVEDNSLFSLDSNTRPILIEIVIDGTPHIFNLDTGSSFTVVSERYYFENFSKYRLKKTDKVFNLYNGNQIIPLGLFNCCISFQNKLHNLNIYVIKTATGPPLLGRDFFSLFGLNIFDNNFIEYPPDIQFLVDKFKFVFESGLGKFTKGVISIKLKTDNVTPKFFRARPLPFAMREKVEVELYRLINLGVLEPVDYSPWGTPIVPVLKKDGSVRICGDFKVTLNPYIEIDQYPLPRIEELFVTLQGGQEFTKLDLANAYTQVCLDEKSKDLVTISTHKGLFRYTRAPFGIACIPAKFQKMMESLLSGLPGVIIFQDDILITGKDRTEHIGRLKQVLIRLEEAGLKISLNKCEFFKSKVSYLGFIIDKHGLHTCENKISAIKNAPIPRNITQLKSFLGLINYYGRFVANLTNILYPLYSLLKNEGKWNWSREAQNSFEKIKLLLMSADVLVHYNPEFPVRLITDASSYGIGCVITHILPGSVEKPIAYASRTLSIAEQKYSQIEKEGLAIIFGLCKFNQYLYGRKFTLVTDHKPLISIFNPRKGIPQFSANRLRRWAVILSNYIYDIEFVPSKKNYADSLSRLPEFEQNADWEDVDVDFINYFSNNPDFPITFSNVKRETSKDLRFLKIIEFVQKGWPRKIVEDYLKPFYRIRNDIAIEQGCLMWNNRLIIPEILRKDILNDLHSSHMGVVKMKSLARSYFWWPGLDKNIEELCSNCENCLFNKKSPDKALLNHWPWTSEVWSRIHIDFMGPFLNTYFFILVDSHSKWIEVYPMKSITTKLTCEVLRSSFARFGLPRQVVTDNAPTFTSNEFKKFLEGNNIKHMTSPPYQPSSNGAAENAVKIIKNSLKRVLGKSSNLDLNKAINNFLFDYRNTIHGTTGVSPAHLMFGRKLRTRFDLLLPEIEHKDTGLKDHVVNIQTKQKLYHGGKRFLEFENNDEVTVRDYRDVTQSRWINGIIFKRIGKTLYLVKIPDLANVIWKRHLNQIKRKLQLPELSVSNSFDSSQSENEKNKESGDSPNMSSDIPYGSEIVDTTSDTTSETNNTMSETPSETEKMTNDKDTLMTTRPKRQIKPVDRLNYK